MNKVSVCDVSKYELIKEDAWRTDCLAAVRLRIHPDAMVSFLETYSPGQPVSQEIWHNRAVTIDVGCDGVVDGQALVNELRGVESQKLLCAICNGHRVAWNGNNYVGELDAAATEALEKLTEFLEHAPAMDIVAICPAGEWLGSQSDEEVAGTYGVTADSTNEQLDEIAERMVRDAEDEGVILRMAHSYLVELRDALRKEVQNPVSVGKKED